MRSVAVALALAAVVAAGSAGGLAASGRPVTATVVVRGYPLLCGKPRGAIAIAFPAALELPSTIAAGAVRMNGQPPAKVDVHGRTATVTAPLVAGVTCQSIILGRLTVVFGRAAGIDSSAKPGTYAVTVRQGVRRYKATLTVGA